MLLLAARWTLGASHQHRRGKFITDTETWFNLKRRFPWLILRTRWLNVVDLDFQQNHVGLAETCNKHNISNHLCNVKSQEFQPWTAEQWSESYSNWQKRPQALHADMLPQVSSAVLARLPVSVKDNIGAWHVMRRAGGEVIKQNQQHGVLEFHY